MSKIDLSGYNLAELKGLQFDIEKAIKDRQSGDLKKAREEIQAIAQRLGVSVDDLLGGSGGKSGGKSKGSTGVKVARLYQNPADASQTWSGRGRKPAFVTNTLENGGTLEDLRIKK